jgi:hypothetical protein
MFLLMCVGPPALPASGSRYRLTFQNHYVEVFRLELEPDRQAPVHDNIYDLLWIPLDGAVLQFQDSTRPSRDVELGPGDLRFFQKHTLKSVVNKTGTTVHAIVIDIRQGKGFESCGCLSDVERAVCGCGGAPHLPEIWALAGSDFTLAQATLQPREAMRETTERDDTLLVAIRPLQLKHEVNTGKQWEWVPAPSTNISLAAGDVEWLEKGKHHLTNEGAKPARFISVEF